MDPFVIGDDSFQEVERLKTTNALYLSSLENAGVDGDPELGVYPYPHAGNAYVIENDPDALELTLFIAWYWDFSETWGEASSVSSQQEALTFTGTLSDEISTTSFSSRFPWIMSLLIPRMRRPSLPREPSNSSFRIQKRLRKI